MASLRLYEHDSLKLTVPEAGCADMRTLSSDYLREQYRLLVRWLMILQKRPRFEGAKTVLDSVRGLVGANPGLLFSVIRRSSFGGLLRCIDGQLRNAEWTPNAEQWSTELLSELVAELSRHESIIGENSSVDESGQSSTRENSRWPVVDGIVLSLVDNNPMALMETHPDKDGNGVDLGGKSVEEWAEVLREAFKLIESAFPEIYAEMKLGLQQIIPVGYDEKKHLSASYQEFVGTIYLTLHPDVLTMVEALIHEFSHTKMNMLWSLDYVLHNAFNPLFTSPFRPDPRPLHGILLGLHAFLPIEYFYERMTASNHVICNDPGWEKRRSRLRDLNSDAARTVALHGEPTVLGQRVLNDVEYWNGHFSSI